MSLSVKVFYDKKNDDGTSSQEIRRFAVDQDVATNFEYLSKKILQAYPNLVKKKLTHTWKDSENDLITFSSDEELMEALGCLDGNVFKIYLFVQDDKTVIQENTGVKHPNVICDGCEGEVYGTRFKCMVCRDYDLCSVCEAKGQHTIHEMIRMRTPRQQNNNDLFEAMWKESAKPVRHGRHGRHRHHHHHHPPPPPPPPHGFPPPPPHGLPPPPPYPPPTAEGPPPPPYGDVAQEHMPPPPPGHPPSPHWDPRTMPPQWRKWMRKWMGYWVADRCMSPMEASGQERGPTAEASTSNAGGSQAASAQPEARKEETPCEEYLKAVGEQVAAMLDPLGIDVAVDVEHGSKRIRCNGSPSEEGGEEPMQVKTEAKENTDDVEMTEVETGEKPPTTAPAPAKEQVKAVESDPTEEWTILDPQSGQPQARPTSAGPMDQEAANTETAQEKVPTPEPPKPAPQTPSHPNPRVASALTQMLQMGFNDDGGWLTRLLEAKGGNISDVLDAIQPRK